MYNLSIVTPEKIFYEGRVTSLIAPGVKGYLGVLTDHAPLITAIKPGKVTIKEENDNEIFLAVSFGFLEVSSNDAILLVDSAEYVSDIDAERAKQALERARKYLIDAVGKFDLPRARKALERAKNRLQVSSSEID